MALIALLDAHVLVNAPIRDVLFRAAEHDLYQLALTDEIIEEMRRALEGNLGRTRRQTDYLVREIRRSFEDAFVEDYQDLIPVMRNDPGDRHVLAAAVQASAGSIVTFNLRHFPVDALARYDVEAQHPDEFLLTLWSLDERLVVRILKEQAEDLSGWDVGRLVDRLQQDVGTFARAVRSSGLLE
jgi:predicted nucleic acid-binding protein